MAKNPATLQYGPYRAPVCRIGDPLVCRFAGERIVAGITSAPVPWPYFWGPQYRRLLFVVGDLERALGCETQQAIIQAFQTSRSDILRWRRVLAIKAFFGPRPFKISDDQVDQLRTRAAAGESRRSLAREFGISVAYASVLVSHPKRYRRRRRPAG